jgi:hypothetical protein
MQDGQSTAAGRIAITPDPCRREQFDVHTIFLSLRLQ